MFKYNDNDQLKKEIRQLIKESGVKQIDLCETLGITPQNLVCTLNKKNLSFADLKRICDALGIDYYISFKDDVTPTNDEMSNIFKAKCEENGFEMNEALEILMSGYINGDIQIEKIVSYRIK